MGKFFKGSSCEKCPVSHKLFTRDGSVTGEGGTGDGVEGGKQPSGERAHKQLLHPQVNDTEMERAETGSVVAMGARPPPSSAAAPAPAPPPAEAAPAAPLVFSPQISRQTSPGEKQTNAARSRSGKGRPSQRWPVLALRDRSGLRAPRGSRAEPAATDGGQPPSRCLWPQPEAAECLEELLQIGTGTILSGTNP